MKRLQGRTGGGYLPVPVLSFTLIAAVLALIPMTSCEQSRTRSDLARRIAEQEGGAGDDERIAELKAQIRSVEAEVERTIGSVRRLGTYWRLLGLKYMDHRMWAQAAAAFDEAIAVDSEYAVLHYQRGLCHGQIALTRLDAAERLSDLERSENGYRRALVLDPRYTPAMYALSALLVFELGRSPEAIPLLRDYLAIERSDVNARFLLARAFLETGRASEALILYDEIRSIAKDPGDIERADDLYRRVAGGEYGS